MTGNITQARSSLDQLLKQLADKEESTILDEDVKEPERLQIGSQPSTPRKRPTSSGNRTPRKRMKKEIVSQDIENQANIQTQHAHIYKLFDRSVDFAKYNNNTSLYVLARAWMKNKPHEMETISLFENPSTSDFSPNDNIRSLPPPVNTGEPCSIIPTPLPRTQTLSLKLEDPQVDPPRPADLLSQHMAHWKIVRKNWKEASHQNQRRYMSSIQIIRRHFNQQM